MEFTAQKARERAEASAGRMEEFIEKAEKAISDAADKGKYEAWVEVPGSIAPGNTPGERMNQEFRQRLTDAGYNCKHFNGGTMFIDFYA